MPTRRGAFHEHDAGSRGAGSRTRYQWPPALLLAGVLIVPASIGFARPATSTAPLFQVTSGQWKHALRSWTSYPTGSWTVQGGDLSNKLTGVKFTSCIGGAPCTHYFQSLIEARYHIPTKRYAVDVMMRYQSSERTGPVRGLVLLAPRTSAGPVPWLFMDNNAIFLSCRVNHPVLVGRPPKGLDQGCGWTIPPGTKLLPAGPPTEENQWYHYRLEVRGNQYRYFIDDHLVQVSRDARPAVGRGVVPAFFAIQPSSDTGTMVTNRLWVKSIRITALPSPQRR